MITSKPPSSFISRSSSPLPMPMKCRASTWPRRCTSDPTTSAPAVRARSASSLICSRTSSSVVPGSKTPIRYARSRGDLVVIISKGPPRNRGEASDFVGISELELPHPCHRLFQAGIRRRDRQPEVAFAVLTETNTRCDVDTHLIEHVTCKSDRVIPSRYRRPHIEGSAGRLDVPAQVVERVGDQLVAPGVYLARVSGVLVSPIQGLDRCPLDRLEDAGVDVRLQLADEADDVRPAAPACE